MATLLRLLMRGGYIAHTWSNESVNEPIHVHVTYRNKKSADDARFWLMDDGTVRLDEITSSVRKRDVRELEVYLTGQFAFLKREFEMIHPNNGGLKRK